MSAKPAKMKNYASFAEWKEDQSSRNQGLISELEALIEQAVPNLATTVKWGQGCWIDGDTPRAYIHAEDDHVQLGFYNGVSLNDPQRLLSGDGKYVRFVRIYSKEDIKPEAFSDLIKQAATNPSPAH